MKQPFKEKKGWLNIRQKKLSKKKKNNNHLLKDVWRHKSWSVERSLKNRLIVWYSSGSPLCCVKSNIKCLLCEHTIFLAHTNAVFSITLILFIFFVIFISKKISHRSFDSDGKIEGTTRFRVVSRKITTVPVVKSVFDWKPKISAMNDWHGQKLVLCVFV